MKYGSVCSGIEAATQAWHHMGWKPSFFSEIDAFPCAVLQHHYPKVPLHGDFTTIQDGDYEPINLLVGGTPCQSFSVAGLRKGLDDPRGNLMLGFGALAKRLRPTWLVWENVPGVLSANGGRDFGTFLGVLAELGYGFAYRALDAQFFGVAQRRKRVFVVGYLGDWRPAAAVLFERDSLSGNPAPSREAKEDVAGTFKACASSGGWSNSVDHAAAGYMQPVNTYQNVSHCLNAGGKVAHTLRGEGFDASEDGTGRGTPTISQGMAVRRLTPVECERLQGFPDNFTQIPYRNKTAGKCPDGPRYKALGNSMAVPCMKWIGERIQQVQEAAQSTNTD